MVVADLRADSIFLLTTRKTVRARKERTGVVHTEAVSDYRIEIPKEFTANFHPYIVFIGDDRVLRVIGWRYVGNEEFTKVLLSVSNNATLDTVGLGLIRVDSIAQHGKGNLEVCDRREGSVRVRLTIASDGLAIQRDTLTVPIYSRGVIGYPSPLSNLEVNGGLEPIGSGYYSQERFEVNYVQYSSNGSIGYTWLLSGKVLYGIRNTVITHLHSHEKIVPFEFITMYDSVHSEITAQFPTVDSLNEIELKLVDFSGNTIAEKTVTAATNVRTMFPTTQLKSGIYSVIATMGSKRGVRTVRVR